MVYNTHVNQYFWRGWGWGGGLPASLQTPDMGLINKVDMVRLSPVGYGV